LTFDLLTLKVVS